MFNHICHITSTIQTDTSTHDESCTSALLPHYSTLAYLL